MNTEQEPQARAGETEPSKFDLRYERLHKILSHGHDTNGIDEPMHFVFHLWIGYERELAILATEAKAELTSNRQAIAKKDAALDACVEALESYSKSPYVKKEHPKRHAAGNAAIAQAKEAHG